MKWLRSMADIAVDVACALLGAVGALVEEWRDER